MLTVLQSGQAYSADGLADIVGVSRRTVFRDLKALAAAGVPYQFHQSTGGYAIDPAFFLPPIDLNLREALSLLLLVHKSRTHLPVPFKNAALLAGLKIENSLPKKILGYCSATLANISVKPDSQAPLDSLDSIFGRLQEAIHRSRKTEIQYQSLFENKIITTVIEPYHLMYGNRAWYIIGFSGLHNSMRTFKLNRIRDIALLGKSFIRNKNFSLQEYLGIAWSIIPEGRIYNVRLRFTPKVAQNVSEVHWHSTQQMTFNPDGSLTAEFRVDGLGEISWWVLGYGDQVEVLAPLTLRKRIESCAKKMTEINSTE